MLDMKENGALTKKSDRAKEDKFGQMDQCMKDGGWKIKPTAKEDSFMLTVMSMMDNGLMIKLTDLVFTAILMEPNTRAIGKKINNTEMDSKPGQMVQDMKVNMFKERNMERVNSLGLMVALIMENL